MDADTSIPLEISTKHVNNLELYYTTAQSLSATIALKPILVERTEHSVSSGLLTFRGWSTLRLGMECFAAFVFCLDTWQEEQGLPWQTIGIL